MLNHDGNLMDAASIAAISALSHFRRPDVAIQGRDVTVVSPETPEWIHLADDIFRISGLFHIFVYVLSSSVQRREIQFL